MDANLVFVIIITIFAGYLLFDVVMMGLSIIITMIIALADLMWCIILPCVYIAAPFALVWGIIHIINNM